MTGWKRKTKGQDFIHKRQREQKKRVPVRPNKGELYRGQSQMGVLFMVSPPRSQRSTLGSLQRPGGVHLGACSYISFLSPGWSARLGQPFSPHTSPVTNTPNKGLGFVCVCVCWTHVCSLIFIAFSYSTRSSTRRFLTDHVLCVAPVGAELAAADVGCCFLGHVTQ